MIDIRLLSIQLDVHAWHTHPHTHTHSPWENCLHLLLPRIIIKKVVTTNESIHHDSGKSIYCPLTDGKETEKESNNETRRVRSFSLPRKFSFNASPLFRRKDEKEDKIKVSPLQRSHSTRERRSLPAGTGTDSVDFGAPSTPATGENKQKTSTAGQ